MLEINTLFVSVLLLHTTSTIFLPMVSGSWLDLKSFIPTWMIKRSGLRFSGGMMYVTISSVVDPLKCFTITFLLLLDNSHPYIPLTIESPTLAVTIWSFLRSVSFYYVWSLLFSQLRYWYYLVYCFCLNNSQHCYLLLIWHWQLASRLFSVFTDNKSKLFDVFIRLDAGGLIFDEFAHVEWKDWYFQVRKYF